MVPVIPKDVPTGDSLGLRDALEQHFSIETWVTGHRGSLNWQELVLGMWRLRMSYRDNSSSVLETGIVAVETVASGYDIVTLAL